MGAFSGRNNDVGNHEGLICQQSIYKRKMCELF